MTPLPPEKMDSSTALSIYRQEKERALPERRISHSQLMAEAKEAFAKMLADAQLARKGGRPRTNPVQPGAAKPATPTPAVAAAPKKVEGEKPKAKPATRAKAASAKKSPARKAAKPARVARSKAKAKAPKAPARTARRAVRGKAKKR